MRRALTAIDFPVPRHRRGPRGAASLLPLLLSLALLPVACGTPAPPSQRTSSPPAPGAGPSRPRVLTTFTVLADMAQEVACGRLEVRSITKPGAEIHSYEVTPSDLRRAQGTSLLLENGLGLDQWTHRFTDRMEGVRRVTLSEGVDPLPIGGMEAGAPALSRPNPHAWMSPRLALTYVANIREAFIRLDPAGAATYRRCAAAYGERLRALDADLGRRLDRLAPDRRLLVTCEGAFSYLTRDYKLDEAWLWPVNGEREVTPQRMERVIRTVRKRRVPAVFCESTVDDRAQRRVAAETGARFAGTFHVDSLSGPQGPAATYIDLMHHNVATLLAGLDPAPR